MEEIFVDIIGYENLYQISSLGRVKSLGNNKKRKEKILTPVLNTWGYYKIALNNNNKIKFYLIHRLVFQHFNGELLPNFVIDHINGNKINNLPENLQQISQRENCSKDQWKRGKTSKFTGVSWMIKNKKWRAVIEIKNKVNHIGLFNTEQEASDAYQKALKVLIK